MENGVATPDIAEGVKNININNTGRQPILNIMRALRKIGQRPRWKFAKKDA